VWLHRPELATGAEIAGGYLRYRSTLASVVRECVILTVARCLESEFEWSFHLPLALAEGADVATVAKLRAREFDLIGGDIGLTAQFASSLVDFHRVPDELFTRAARRWDSGELIDLASLIGYYCFVGAVLNAFDVTSSLITGPSAGTDRTG
jgi:alkylhydroperoxidase family enzyme